MKPEDNAAAATWVLVIPFLGPPIALVLIVTGYFAGELLGWWHL